MTTLGHFPGSTAPQAQQKTLPRFGSEESTSSQNTESADEFEGVSSSSQSEEDTPKQKPDSMVDKAQDFIAKQKVFKGIKGFFSTFGKALDWNRAFGQAHPDSSPSNRILAVFILAAAQFIETVAEDPESPQAQAPQDLYAAVLKTFPKLIFSEQQAAQKLLEKLFSEEKLDELRENYSNDTSGEALKNLKAQLAAALKDSGEE